MAINFTYSFSPATTIVSNEMNTDLTDLRDAIRAAHHQDADGTKIVNADISSSAAIAESKVNFNTSSGHDHDGSDSKRLTGLNSTHFSSLSAASLTTADWDVLFSGGDPVHSHASTAEGGSLDSRYLRSDTSDTFNGNLDITGYVYSVRNRVTGASGGGYMEFREQSTGPSTPGTDYVKVWFDGSGNIWFTKDDGTNARINLSTGVITGYS